MINMSSFISNIIYMVLFSLSVSLVAGDADQYGRQYAHQQGYQQGSATYNYYNQTNNQFNYGQPSYPVQANTNSSGIYEYPANHPDVMSFPLPPQHRSAQDMPSYRAPRKQYLYQEYTTVSDKGLPYLGQLLKSAPALQPVKHRCVVDGCTATYSRISDLTCHYQLRHPDYAERQKLFSGKYPCHHQDCTACFTRKKMLQRHINKFHKVVEHRNGDTSGDYEPPEPLEEDDGETADDQGTGDLPEQAQAISKFSLSFICSDDAHE